MEEIKKLLKTDKLILGADRTLKALREGTAKKVFVASNVSEKLLEDLEQYSKLNSTELIKTDKTNEQLGVFCKKSFSVQVITILK